MLRKSLSIIKLNIIPKANLQIYFTFIFKILLWQKARTCGLPSGPLVMVITVLLLKEWQLEFPIRSCNGIPYHTDYLLEFYTIIEVEVWRFLMMECYNVQNCFFELGPGLRLGQPGCPTDKSSVLFPLFYLRMKAESRFWSAVPVFYNLDVR